MAYQPGEKDTLNSVCFRSMIRGLCVIVWVFWFLWAVGLNPLNKTGESQVVVMPFIALVTWLICDIHRQVHK